MGRSVSLRGRGVPREEQEAAGVAKARRAAQGVRLQCPRVASIPLFWGRPRSLDTRYSAGATRAICTASLQARGARGGRGCPSPSRLLLHLFLSGKSLPVQLGGAQHGRRLERGCSAPRGRTRPGTSSLLSRGSLHLQLPENKCPPHGVTHLL